MTPLPVPIVDSHCHLDYPALADDLHAVLERAGEAGVRLILTIGTQVNEFDRVLALAEAYEDRGIKRVRPLAGGFTEWRRRNFPVENVAQSVHAGGDRV